MAFEPQVRRRYPEALITWSRVLAGRLRDPRAGADVLIGVALGACGLALSESLLTPPGLSAPIGPLPSSTGMVVGFWLYEALGALLSLAYLFLLNLVSTLVRRRWLAASIFVLLPTLVSTVFAEGAWLAIAVTAAYFGMIAFALIRFGVLAVSAMVFTQLTLQTFPFTTNWSSWNAQSSLLAVCILIGFALYGFCTTLAGRELKDQYP